MSVTHLPPNLLLAKHLKNRINWYPGHMVSGLRKIKKKLEKVSVLVEVRDSRIPYSSANPVLQRLLTPNLIPTNTCEFQSNNSYGGSHRPSYEPKQTGYANFVRTQNTGVDELKLDVPRIVILTKTDLAWPTETERARRTILRNEGAAAVILTARGSYAYSAAREFLNELVRLRAHSVVVCGMPNMGKSTFINVVRSISGLPKAAPTGVEAGVTRKVTKRMRLCSTPLIYVVDSPGINDPHLRNAECVLNLALAEGYPFARTCPEQLAEFMYLQLRRAWYGKLIEKNPLCEISRFSRRDSELFQDLDKISTAYAFRSFLTSISRQNSSAQDKNPQLVGSDSYATPIGISLQDLRFHQQASRDFLLMFRHGRLGNLTLDKVSEPYFDLAAAEAEIANQPRRTSLYANTGSRPWW